MPIPPWLIADNGVRNPKRLKDGLRVLVNSEFHGNFSKENEEGMALLLAEEEVISLQTNTDNTISRKWRLNLIRLGFISNDTHTVTENGRRLIHSASLPAEEECFLRALLAHQIPSAIHTFTKEEIEPFNPLRMVLAIIDGLRRREQRPEISKNELASIVILRYNMQEIPQIIEEVVSYRIQREHANDKRKFDNQIRESSASYQGKVSANSLRDYADVNIRYLKLTGLFAEDGNKLSIAIHKETIVEQILAQPYLPISEHDYENTLGTGIILPTDDENEAITAIRSIHRLLIGNGETADELPDLHTFSIQDLSQLRLRLENDWIHVLESRYAEEQVERWEDILRYLRALQNPRDSRLIPNGEAPAYLEWTIWRAFLAMNSLVNHPWEARRFRIDRSFLPVRHAPGGGPDMIFEFNDFVIVMEVTLTSSSRQEAAEGEPVRRHVAQYVDTYNAIGKRVYGLFMANNIDTNTAETFRIGIWYRADNSELALQIVPLTLSDFTNLFEAIFTVNQNSEAKNIIKQFLNDSLSHSNNRAPEWKNKINEEVNRNIRLLHYQ